jgi:hypothetical protein
MKVHWQFYVLCVVLALLPCGLIAADASNEPAPSLERLQRAPLIRCVINEFRSGQRREVTFTDSAQLERVRAWIQQYAWPPIDRRTTGNVMPRGHFAVFDRADAAKPAFIVPVYGVTTRTEPQITHVTNENWQKFLSLIPPK